MPSTYSPNLGLELPASGEQYGNWGEILNENLSFLEQAISGYTVVPITDGADTVITMPDAATGAARYMYLELAGTLTASRNLVVPAKAKLYFIWNNTAGGQAVTVKLAGSAGVSVAADSRTVLICNSVEVFPAVTVSEGGGGIPGGADREIQFNNAGAFGASPGLLYSSTDDTWWGGSNLQVMSTADSAYGATISVISDGYIGILAADAFNDYTGKSNGIETNGATNLWLGRSRGTFDEPSGLLVGDAIGKVMFSESHSSDTAAMISAEVKAIGAHPSANLIFGTSDGTNAWPMYRMRLDADGGLVLRPNATTDPAGGSKGPGTINAIALYGNTGAITADKPVLDLTQTWNNAAVSFTGLKLTVTTTAQASPSKYFQFNNATAGAFNFYGERATSIDSLVFAGANTAFRLRFATETTDRLALVSQGGAGMSGLRMNIEGTVDWSSSSSSVSSGVDLRLFRDAAATLAQRNGTNAQTYRLYNTYTDGSNYERAKFAWESNTLRIGTEKLGTGIARGIEIVTDGTVRLTINSGDGVAVLSGNAVLSGANWLHLNGSGATSTNGAFAYRGGQLSLPSGGGLYWSQGVSGSTNQTGGALLSEAASTYAFRNGANAQIVRSYNTWTDASNYERGKFAWESNILKIGTEKLGTGLGRAVEIQTDGVTRMTISETGAIDFATTPTVGGVPLAQAFQAQVPGGVFMDVS